MADSLDNLAADVAALSALAFVAQRQEKRDMDPTNDFDRFDTDYTASQTFKPGDRVELHPGCDLWMRGAKFGEVVYQGRFPHPDGCHVYRVKMDNPNVRGKVFVRTDRLRHVR